ncbi:uncharacterized protein PV09_03087 [Verruconis gallopava]|uniref:Uncharacterized protein n=1 Tax=Verruconis gallopava TaxID=253628 RepID=A0A0D1YYX7_9PEZI|nr:uncharacterized protein PV09_03087 [Verruconis gallopava]KIW05892.1 hypothetical protein PV09_03087 [Verruconis gallopava]
MGQKKRIQITSDVTADTEHFYERVEHPSTGTSKVVEHKQPRTSSSSVTITTNPYVVETDGSPENTRTKQGASATVELEKKGYDTSQL